MDKDSQAPFFMHCVCQQCDLILELFHGNIHVYVFSPFSFKIKVEKGIAILPNSSASAVFLTGNGQWNVLQLYHDQKPPSLLYFHELSQSLWVSYHLCFDFTIFRAQVPFRNFVEQCISKPSLATFAVPQSFKSPCLTPRLIPSKAASSVRSLKSVREKKHIVFRSGSRRWFQSKLCFLPLRLKQD